MRTADAQSKIRESALLLDCDLMRAKLAEYQRFGLPGASSSDGRGGEPPLPLLGTTDRSILRDRNLYSELLTDAAVALERALRLQRSWCVPRTDETEKAKQLEDEQPGKPCSNLWCDHFCSGKKDDVLRNGRCPTCAMYYRRTGNERPRELCQPPSEPAPCSGGAT